MEGFKVGGEVKIVYGDIVDEVGSLDGCRVGIFVGLNDGCTFGVFDGFNLAGALVG